jgi:hypothetical protein
LAPESNPIALRTLPKAHPIKIKPIPANKKKNDHVIQALSCRSTLSILSLIGLWRERLGEA